MLRHCHWISEQHVLENAVRLAKTIYPKHVWKYDLGIHVRSGFEHVEVYMFVDGDRWKNQTLETLRYHTPLQPSWFLSSAPMQNQKKELILER